MRRYESMFILHPELAQEETQEAVEKFQNIVTRDNGKIIRTDSMGIRKLSFDIKKQSRGFYVLLDYAGNPEIIRELERNFRIDERVLNYQTIKLKNTITEEEIEALIAKRQTQAKEEEEREEKFAEQDTAINMISREEDSHKDKIDTPSSGEHIDEIQSEQTKEEESTDSAQGSGVIGPDNAENI